MPRATADASIIERHDLKTIPDGYVVGKRLTYGEKLARREMVSKMKFEGGKGKDFEGEMQLMNARANMYDFEHCIVEHNLTKPNPADPKDETQDLPIDFGNLGDIRALDPRV